MTYLPPELISDEGANAEAILAYLRATRPDWDPEEGDAETSIAEALGVTAGTIATLAKDRAALSYIGWGETVAGIPRLSEEVARATSTWVASHDLGVVIPAGSELIVISPSGERVAFATQHQVEIPGGQTSITGVPVAAMEPGPEGNGLIGPSAAVGGGNGVSIEGIVSAALETVSAGGQDREPLEDYIERLARRGRQMRVVAIVITDYAELPLDVVGVARCMAVRWLDLTDPPAPGDPPASAGHISIFPIDAAGNEVASTRGAAIRERLFGPPENPALRPVNVTLHIGQPTYTPVPATVEVILEPDVDEGEVLDAVEAAVTAALSPATFGYRQLSAGRWHAPTSIAERTIRAWEIAHVARSVPGVAAVVDATVDAGDSIVLDGWAPLPTPGSITITAVP